MFRKIKPFFIITETSLHPGSGSELGMVDLPIQRERHTNYPKIEGSGLKGSFREVIYSSNKEIEINSQKIKPRDKIKYNEENTEKETDYLSLIFGPEPGNEHAGSIAFTDARILLFPVKSLQGVFGWITCPFVLERFKEDLMIADRIEEFPINDFSKLENTYSEKSNLVIGISSKNKIVLEEYAFEVKYHEKTTQIAKWFARNIFPSKQDKDSYKYWREKLERDLVIFSDEDFREFVTSSTEVIARTVINIKTGTADNLWYEEYLSPETILYSLAMASPVRVKKDDKKGALKAETTEKEAEKEAEKVLEFFIKGCPKVLQIGGNQTIGKGIVRIQILNE